MILPLHRILLHSSRCSSHDTIVSCRHLDGRAKGMRRTLLRRQVCLANLNRHASLSSDLPSCVVFQISQTDKIGKMISATRSTLKRLSLPGTSLYNPSNSSPNRQGPRRLPRPRLSHYLPKLLCSSSYPGSSSIHLAYNILSSL